MWTRFEEDRYVGDTKGDRKGRLVTPRTVLDVRQERTQVVRLSVESCPHRWGWCRHSDKRRISWIRRRWRNRRRVDRRGCGGGEQGEVVTSAWGGWGRQPPGVPIHALDNWRSTCWITCNSLSFRHESNKRNGDQRDAFSKIRDGERDGFSKIRVGQRNELKKKKSRSSRRRDSFRNRSERRSNDWRTRPKWRVRTAATCMTFWIWPNVWRLKRWTQLTWRRRSPRSLSIRELRWVYRRSEKWCYENTGDEDDEAGSSKR